MTTRPITNLGATRARSIAYDSTKAAIAIPQLTTADTFATLDAEQTFTNKTLTAPVIDSITTEDGGTVEIPTVASGSTATLATTADITSAIGGIDLSTLATTSSLNTEKTRIDLLISYLSNWINVGNLSMSDLRTYINYSTYDFVLDVIKTANTVGDTIQIKIIKCPSGFNLYSIREKGLDNDFSTNSTVNGVITLTLTRVLTKATLWTNWISSDEYFNTPDIDTSIITTTGGIIAVEHLDIHEGGGEDSPTE